MSELNYLEKLLDGTEVEWKALGDVTSVLRGKRLTKNLLSAEEKFPVFHGGLEPLGYYNKSNRPANTVMIINVGASAGTVGYSTVDFWSSDGCFCLEHNELLNNRFLYFALIGYQSLLKSKVRVAGIPTLDAIVVNKLLIPIPCPENPEKSLAIQSEIVRILDKFTALTAELTAELNMRKKQYNYYRDQLLSFKEGEVEWKALGEIGEVRMCKRILKSQTSSEGEIPFYKIGTFGKEPDSYISRKLFNEFKEKYSYPKVGEVLISASGTIGRTVIFDGRESYFQDSNIVWIENNEKIVLNKYLFYFYKIAKWGISEGGTIKRLYNDNLRKLMIPVPFPDSPERSLVEQQKIVKLLDKFDALTNSITEGLPREIELRQKQYEYYRDLLFSFPKPETVSN
ncbi:restriction endonuclease subunit S [Escherichia coli]|uniref:restriction endonuclease subunit S n=1 Tax=Escherichia coli TaxID=562 RepID=UPI001BD4FEE0|nr:restriction endonuclease subunit S [Escherichia coli]MBS9700334.1 restriction endonuclease subunit S [Escherichia coli]